MTKTARVFVCTDVTSQVYPQLHSSRKRHITHLTLVRFDLVVHSTLMIPLFAFIHKTRVTKITRNWTHEYVPTEHMLAEMELAHEGSLTQLNRSYGIVFAYRCYSNVNINIYLHRK